MRSFDDCTSSPNAFTPSFLERFGGRDEPVTAGEADVAGPWRVVEVPAGYGLFRLGESLERGFGPAAVFRDRSLALLAAAILPGTGRDAAFRLHKEKGTSGFVVESLDGEVAGHTSLFDENLIAALHVAESVVRSPAALADLLEAAGPLALERAGAILEARI